jgi:hypothetical protein
VLEHLLERVLAAIRRLHADRAARRFACRLLLCARRLPRRLRIRLMHRSFLLALAFLAAACARPDAPTTTIVPVSSAPPAITSATTVATAPVASASASASASSDSPFGTSYGDLLGPDAGIAFGISNATPDPRAMTIGLGNAGTLNHGNASPSTDAGAASNGGDGGAHTTPVIYAEPYSGSEATELVKVIIRRHFGEMRACYDTALQKKPDLKGKVIVRFIIAHDGSVRTAADFGSDLPDAATIACVVGVFQSLVFPSAVATGGEVTVTYPLVFVPS